jgi:tetratricopeptide (TPR) repeat protein
VSLDDLKVLLDTAKDHFNKGHYKLAEPLLIQLQSEPNPKPDVAYMLASIAFDKGQLKRAIQLFKQSLEIDPEFTDSSVGLSIILNDLGRYDEAKKVFEDAYGIMKQKQQMGKDAFLLQKLAQKHMELGDLYSANQFYQEAINEYQKALKHTPNNLELQNKLDRCVSLSSSTDSDLLQKQLDSLNF